MTKWKDTTAGGYKILWREEIKEGERKGWFMGEIDMGYGYHIVRGWTPEGYAHLGTPLQNLVPAEPEVIRTSYINIYEDRLGLSYCDNEKWPTKHNDCLGRIRIDWLDNGTYTVTKEEV